MLNDMKLKLILEAIDKASPELKKVKGGVDQVGTSAEVSTKSMNRFGAVLGPAAIAAAAAATAAALIRLGKAVLEAGMAWDRLENAMLSVKGSAAGAATELSFVTAEAKRLGLDLETAGHGFTQLAAAAKGTAVTSAQVRDIFTAVGEASVVLGLSAADASGAIRAISQVMSKGTVQAEELRGQLGERIPGAFQIAARAMGKTTAELNKMLEMGQLLSDDFLPKFAAQMHKEFGSTVPEATKKLQAELNRLKTAWFELKVEFGEGDLMEIAVTGVRSLTETIQDLTGAIDSLSDRESSFMKTVEWLNQGALQISWGIAQMQLAAREMRLSGTAGSFTPEQMAAMNFDGSNKVRLGLGISDDLSPSETPTENSSTPQKKAPLTEKEIEAFQKSAKGITDSWEQMYRDRYEIQSRSLDVQIQMEKEAAELSRIPWEATKDFWQIQAEDKFEVLSRSTEALIAMDKSWQSALMDGLDELADYYDETFSDRMTGTVFDAFSTMEDTMVDFVLTGKASFKDMINSILADITRLVVQQNITGPLASALNVGLSGLFGSGDVSFGAASAKSYASANGNIFSNGSIIPFANGTIVTKPTYFPMAGGNTGLMGEAGEEGILPLKRINGKLGVLAQGGGGMTSVVNMNLDLRGADQSAVPRLVAQAEQISDLAVQKVRKLMARGDGTLR